MADRVSQSVSKGLADLVLNDDDFLDQPTFQKAAHEGAGLVEVANNIHLHPILVSVCAARVHLCERLRALRIGSTPPNPLASCLG